MKTSTELLECDDMRNHFNAVTTCWEDVETPIFDFTAVRGMRKTLHKRTKSTVLLSEEEGD